MSLVYDAQQRELSESLTRLVTDRDSLRELSDLYSGEARFSRSAWAALVDVGLPAMTVPSRCGGLGAAASDVAVAFRVIGSGLLATPLLGSAVVAIITLTLLDDESVPRQVLSELAAGRQLAALAVSERGCRTWVPEAPGVAVSGPLEAPTVTARSTTCSTAPTRTCSWSTRATETDRGCSSSFAGRQGSP